MSRSEHESVKVVYDRYQAEDPRTDLCNFVTRAVNTLNVLREINEGAIVLNIVVKYTIERHPEEPRKIETGMEAMAEQFNTLEETEIQFTKPIGIQPESNDAQPDGAPFSEAANHIKSVIAKKRAYSDMFSERAAKYAFAEHILTDELTAEEWTLLTPYVREQTIPGTDISTPDVLSY